MDAKEIREIKIHGEFNGGMRSDNSYAVGLVLLREIAAQLAELNAKLPSQTVRKTSDQ